MPVLLFRDRCIHHIAIEIQMVPGKANGMEKQAFARASETMRHIISLFTFGFPTIMLGWELMNTIRAF